MCRSTRITIASARHTNLRLSSLLAVAPVAVAAPAAPALPAVAAPAAAPLRPCMLTPTATSSPTPPDQVMLATGQ